MLCTSCTRVHFDLESTSKEMMSVLYVSVNCRPHWFMVSDSMALQVLLAGFGG